MTFLNLVISYSESLGYLDFQKRDRNLSDFIKYILIWVLKMNQSFIYSQHKGG